MTKSQLVGQLAEATQQSKKEAEQIVDLVFAGITEALRSGERLDVRGFGSFKVRDQKARQGRNPRTGEPLLIPAKKVAVFKPSRNLAESLNRAEVITAAPSM
jgi:integration host factor subunit beta